MVRNMKSTLSFLMALLLILVYPLSTLADDTPDPNTNPIYVTDEGMKVYDIQTGQWIPIDSSEFTGDLNVVSETDIKTDTVLSVEDTSFTAGSVNMAVVEDGMGVTSAVSVVSNDEDEASLTVNHDITAKVDITSAAEHTETIAVNASAQNDSGSNVKVTVDGTVSSEAVSQSGSMGSETVGVAAVTQNATNTVNVDIEKNVSAKSTSETNAVAEAIRVTGPGKTEINVGGDVTAIAKATSQNGTSDAYGIYVKETNADVKITVDGNASAFATSDRDSASVNAILTSINGGSANIHVKQDVTAENKSNTFGEGTTVSAISAQALNGASVVIQADGDVSASSSHPGTVYAVQAKAAGDKSLTDVTIGGKTQGLIEGRASDGGTVKVSVGNGIVTENWAAVDNLNNNGTLDLNVIGDIAAKDSPFAVLTQTSGDKGVSTLTAEGNISSKNDDGGFGVIINAYDGGTAIADFSEGSISVETKEAVGTAIGLAVSNGGGKTKITASADITASGAKDSIGVSLMSASRTSYSIDQTAEPVDSIPENPDTTQTVSMDGKEYNAYWFGEDCYIQREDGKYHKLESESSFCEGTNELYISGDVTGDQVGMALDIAEVQTADVIVDGTVEGGEHGIVLVSDETIVGENLTITVWEIKPNEDGAVVFRRETEDGQDTVNEDREAEKAIQYIIRIRPDQKEIISTRGTMAYEGYDVAHEGDTVTLKLNIPYGYEISGAYRDAEQEVKLLQDAEGDYYLIVPRGGAVELSVTLKYVLDDVKSESDSGTAAAPQVLRSMLTDSAEPFIADKATYGTLPKGGSITWLRESSGGQSLWYGVDNSEGALPAGSIVSVRMISKNEDPEMFLKLYNQANEGLSSSNMMVKDNKIWIFELNAYKKNGGLLNNEFASGKSVDIYVELGTDWDLSDIKALFFADADGEPGKLLDEPRIEEKEINGDKKEFAVMKMTHFSTYAIADTKPLEGE